MTYSYKVSLIEFKDSPEDFSKFLWQLLESIAKENMKDKEYLVMSLKFSNGVYTLSLHVPYLYPYVSPNHHFETIFKMFFHICQDNVLDIDVLLPQMAE
jgi:ubiquitin-protein ligase